MSHQLRRPQTLLAIAILLLALALRLRGLDTTSLWGDQAFTLNTAMRWVNGGPIPLAANKSSVGFLNPPMIEYLYAAALFVWRDILSVSILTLLGGLLAVAVTGYITARLFGRRAGLWAMLAFAVTPWAVFWSQLIWNQTMVPPFAALALGGLLLYLFDRPRAGYLIVSFAAAAAMTQVHPGTAVQVLGLGLSLLLYRRRVRWSHALAGAGVFVLLYVPYLVYQVGTGWADLRAMRGLAGQGAAASSAAIRLSLDLIHAQGLYADLPRVAIFDRLATLLYAAALVVVLAQLALSRHQIARTRGNAAGSNGVVEHQPGDESPNEAGALVVVLLWFALPVLFYLRSAVYLQNYYLVGQWPAHFMILGVGLQTAQRAAERAAWRQRAWRAAAWLLPLPLLALALVQIFASLRYQAARAAGEGPPFQVRDARLMIDHAQRLLAERPGCRLVGIGHGHQVENSDLALLSEFTDSRRVLLSDGDLALPLPSPCAIYLNARPGSLASYALEAQAQPIPAAAINLRVETWQFYTWTAEPLTVAPGAPQWVSGPVLAGHFHDDPLPGRDLTLTLVWKVVGPRPTEAYHFGVYLLDEHGVVAQQDGPGFDTVQWRAGDGFVTWFTLAVPDEPPARPYQLAVALYSWPGQARAELIGGGSTAYLGEIMPVAP